MITTQRLIIIGIMLNILLGIGANVYINPTTLDTRTLSGHTDRQQGILDQFMNEDELTAEADNPEMQEERSAGNLLYWTTTILTLIGDIMWPASIEPWQFTNTLEILLAWIIVLMRILFGILMIIEIIMFIKNKKAT